MWSTTRNKFYGVSALHCALCFAPVGHKYGAIENKLYIRLPKKLAELTTHVGFVLVSADDETEAFGTCHVNQKRYLLREAFRLASRKCPQSSGQRTSKSSGSKVW